MTAPDSLSLPSLPPSPSLQGFFLDREDPVWFPPKLYYISKLRSTGRTLKGVREGGREGGRDSGVGGSNLGLFSGGWGSANDSGVGAGGGREGGKEVYYRHFTSQHQSMKKLQREIDRLAAMQVENTKRQGTMDEKLQAALTLLQSLHQREAGKGEAGREEGGMMTTSGSSSSINFGLPLAGAGEEGREGGEVLTPVSEAVSSLSSVESFGSTRPHPKRPPPLFSPAAPALPAQRVQELVEVVVTEEEEGGVDGDVSPASGAVVPPSTSSSSLSSTTSAAAAAAASAATTKKRGLTTRSLSSLLFRSKSQSSHAIVENEKAKEGGREEGGEEEPMPSLADDPQLSFCSTSPLSSAPLIRREGGREGRVEEEAESPVLGNEMEVEEEEEGGRKTLGKKRESRSPIISPAVARPR